MHTLENDVYTLHVAPLGSDSACGSKQKPLASLKGARDYIRQNLQSVQEVHVHFADGDYILRDTVIFNQEDGRGEGGKILYKAVNSGKACFTSGLPLQDWRQLDTTTSASNLPAAKHLWVARLPDAINDCKQLYYEDQPLHRSRSVSFFPLNKNPPLFTWTGKGQNEVICPIRTWEQVVHPEHTEIHLIPIAPWAMNIIPVAKVDRQSW